jgi:hypothetical protein
VQDDTPDDATSADTPDDATSAEGAAPDQDAPAVDPAAEVERLRAENERLRAEVDEVHEVRDASRSRRRRGVLSIALVVLGALLLPIAVMTVWTRNQLLDTDRYLETITPLGSDPAVVNALSTRISNEVTAAIDVKSLAQEALPENAQFLAAPIAAGASTLVHEATTRLLRSDQFETLWVEANRTGHDGLVAVLTGRKGKVVDTENGKVVISLGPLVQEVLNRVDDQFGTDISSRIPASKINIKYTLVDSPQLAKLQNQVRWLDRLSYFSVVLALACFVGAVFAATERRKGLLRVGVGVAVSMLIALVAMSIARTQYLSHLPSQVQSTAAASAVFETLTRFLLQAFRVLFVVGAVILFAAWVAGPSRAATWVRTVWNRALGRGSSGLGGTVELGPVPAWVGAHLGLLRAAVAVVAALALVLWTRPTGKVVLLIAVVALVLLAILQVLGGIAPTPPGGDDETDPDADVPDEGQVTAGA